MTDEEIKKHKEDIDGMTREGMARLWRYAPSGHPYFNRKFPLWEHFDKRFKELGGFSPEISKGLG